jgi:hypothetical protein
VILRRGRSRRSEYSHMCLYAAAAKDVWHEFEKIWYLLDMVPGTV